MKRNYYISVAMATYNGEKYIYEQVTSILNNLLDNDELVISDDHSTDNTLNIIKKINDKRIKILDGPHQGVKMNFSNAIEACTGKYIFLSDQDDIWVPNKVNKVIKSFETENCSCVVHDCDVINYDKDDEIIKSFFCYRKSGKGILKNIYRNSYIGCCMAFSNEMKKYILPIPKNIEMHDQWIGILCECYGKSSFIKDKLIHYRRHGDNTSSMKHYPLWKMIKNRLYISLNLINRRYHIKKYAHS